MKGIGLLWQDVSKEALEVKVQRAADYYYQKYGSRVVRCHVNPAEATVDAVGFIRVVADKHIGRGYLWLMVAEGVQA